MTQDEWKSVENQIELSEPSDDLHLVAQPSAGNPLRKVDGIEILAAQCDKGRHHIRRRPHRHRTPRMAQFSAFPSDFHRHPGPQTDRVAYRFRSLHGWSDEDRYGIEEIFRGFLATPAQ